MVKSKIKGKKKFALLLATCIILIAGGYFLLADRQNFKRDDLDAQAVDPLLEAAALLIKGVSLSQGENGFEFWRLRADWAAMSQENGIINVQQPRVRYTIGSEDNADYVQARANFGRITDKQQILRMWDSVILTRGADTLTSEEMIYRTDERKVRFPNGGIILRPNMEGKFGTMIWDMDANLIDCTNGVDVTFTGENSQTVNMELPPPLSAARNEVVMQEQL